MVDKGTTKKPKGKNKGKTLPIVNWFGRQGCYDTYRILNPQGTDHTWSRVKLDTRIDYIWITENLALGLKEAKIEDMA
ncbi:20385_t:CDS:1, partial [Gigaspora margarita]